jgi:multidrug efflux pump
MNLPELCIRRPVLSSVLNFLIVVLGFVAYNGLSLREYPNIDVPVVTVNVTYRGAAPDIMETQVTKILEDSLSGVEGIDYINSVSRQESSQISVNFQLTRDADSAAADVRDRVARVRSQLPESIDEPIIAKVEADAQPVVYLAFSSDRHSDLEVSDYASRYVKDRVSVLPGVAQVNIFGERRYSMRIWLDRDRLAAYNMTPVDVENAIRRQNLDIPAGRIESTEREFTITGNTDLREPKQFEEIILRQDQNYLVKLKDVARVEQDAADTRTRVRFNGTPAVALGIVKQSTGNPIDVSDALQKALPGIRKDLPEGMKVGVAYDTSVFIRASIEKVYSAIFEAVMFVSIVILLFLRSLRASIIPLVTIPVSLIGAFALMGAMGFSINTLTLLSLVMAVGLVVDDAIVVLENIQRHIEEGMAPFQAALKGSAEIVFAVIAMSITLAAVYTPVAFAGGNTGRLFSEFALTLAGTVLISGWTALTLTPTMCARLLKHEDHSKRDTTISRFSAWLGDFFDNLVAGYRNLLPAVLEMRGFILFLALCVGVFGGVLYTMMPKELAPMEDRGFFIGIALAPEGSSVGYLDQYTRQMENIYRGIPERTMFFMVSGNPNVNQAISFLRLKPWEERTRSAAEISKTVLPQFMMMPGVLAFPNLPPPLGASARSQPLQIVVQSSLAYPELEKIVSQVVQAAAKRPGLFGVDSDLKLNKPELRFDILRDKAATLGIDPAAIGAALQTMFGGAKTTRYQRGVDQYDVIVEVEDDLRRTPNDLTSVYVKAANGSMVQLSDLVTMEEAASPRELNHFNKFRAVTISGNLAPGTSLGEALQFIETEAKKAGDGKIQLDYVGNSREFKKSSTAMLFAFSLALVFIYLVLAAQYESVLDPLVIMLSVPLALAGALITLFIVGGTVNVYSQIGLITLIGLITKHGILIVEFANAQRQLGKSAFDAVVEGASVRLRPILMTTAATILGAMPLALSHGAGAESRMQIGWTIVGGMSFGTLLTLFVVPCVYTYLSRERKNPEIASGTSAPVHGK